MFNDKIKAIIKTPGHLSQKAIVATTQVLKTVTDGANKLRTEAVNNVLESGEKVAWKVADALHDKQIRPTS